MRRAPQLQLTLALLALVLQATASRLRHALVSRSTAELLVATAASPVPSRPRLVVANWKCNGRLGELPALMQRLQSPAIRESKAEVVIAPPFVHLSAVAAGLPPSVLLGAQDVSSSFGYGAFTGEVSGDMLRDVGAEYAIVGHSERRAGFGLLKGESDAAIGEKARVALVQGLRPIVCVGETLAEREVGAAMSVISRQLQALNEAVSPADWASGAIAVAYEPVWAIGTGRSATPEQAQEIHKAIRAWLVANVSPEVAAATPLLYGGSVKAANAQALARQADVDGFLVGGASLTAEFADIVKAVNGL